MKVPHISPTNHSLYLDKLIRRKPASSPFGLLPVTLIAGFALLLMLFVLPALLNH